MAVPPDGTALSGPTVHRAASAGRAGRTENAPRRVRSCGTPTGEEKTTVKRLGLGLALLLVVAACGDDTASTTAAAAIAPAAPTTQPAATTTLAPTTTTSPSTSSTTTQPGFRPAQPSEDERANYLLMAALGLDTTPWNLEEMGDDWIVMLHDAPVAACATLYFGGSLAEAAYAAMQETPLAGQDPTEYGHGLASSLWITMAVSGMPNYCPSLTRGLTDDVTTLVNAWAEMTGGELLDPAKVIQDGTWIVGVEIEPGTYRNSGGSRCYWERLSGFSGTSEDRIANGFSDDQQIVTIDPSDTGFLSEGCSTWFLVE